MSLAWLLITVSAGPFLSLVSAQIIPQLRFNFGFPVDSTRQPGEDNEVNTPFSSFFPGLVGSTDPVDSTTQLGKDNEVNNPFTSSFLGLGGLPNDGNNAVPPITKFTFAEGDATAFTGFSNSGGGMGLLDTPLSPFTASSTVSIFGSFGAGDERGNSIKPFTPSLGDPLASGQNGVSPDAGPGNPDCNPGTGVGCLIGDNGAGINCQQGGDRIICSSAGRPFVDADGMTITSDASTCVVFTWTTTVAVTSSILPSVSKPRARIKLDAPRNWRAHRLCRLSHAVSLERNSN